MTKTITEKDIAVIVPVYKEHPLAEEWKYYGHNSRMLKRYKQILVAPEGMNTEAYTGVKGVSAEFFQKKFFENIAGYNKLMLSEQFYKRFVKYKYILICQTDVFIFKDELLDWCKKDYDYIGAPWVNRAFFLFQYVFVKMGLSYALRMFFTRNLFNAVGNGGLSLRKISTFINVIKNDKKSHKWEANEDFYWSFFAESDGNPISRPTASEAGLFSIEVNPKKLMRRQNNELPMGIHAWERYNPEFWEGIVANALKNNLK
ncbi:MAG: DUF5672 family protein [Bacteroidota bacterium]